MSNAYFLVANLSLCYSRYFNGALSFLEVLNVKRLVFFGWPLVKGLGCACYFGAIRQTVFRDVISGENNLQKRAYVQRWQSSGCH